jgi:4-hydroxyacetophenone monooxygenase
MEYSGSTTTARADHTGCGGVMAATSAGSSSLPFRNSRLWSRARLLIALQAYGSSKSGSISATWARLSSVQARARMKLVWSARAVVVDPEYSILDALQRDNVTLVTTGIERIERGGVVEHGGALHEADVIVYATGFHATEYLFPMTIAGRDGQSIEDLWAKDGARAYLGCMMPGFPNLWSIYGPNTNGALNVASFHEKVALYALQCMETLVLDGRRTMEVRPDAYWRYNRLVDERNLSKAWSDPRAHNYYWTAHGRSAVMNPFNSAEMSGFLRKPDLTVLEIS